MKNKLSQLAEDSFRKFYGKLFSALLSQFGVSYMNEIEDAIQNAFLKSLRSWKPDQLPKNKENWLFIVARNNLLNQIKRLNGQQIDILIQSHEEGEDHSQDLRLKTIFFIAKSKKLSAKAKIIFILKNIFGLHVKEISYSTLIEQDAIYKSISRAKKELIVSPKEEEFSAIFEQVGSEDISIVEEILYAVFNIGFDSLNEKNESIINEDLCLEALALSKMLWDNYGQNSTKNLLALLCFNLARIPEKIRDGKMVSFFDQDRTKWNSQFMALGFHYMEKPATLNKYYLEALIISKHMTASTYDIDHWNDIIKLYQLLLQYKASPIIKLNLCYCLSKAHRVEEAVKLLDKIEKELPKGHIYFALVKANILDLTSDESEKLIHHALKSIKQNIRKEYILEMMLTEI